MPMEMVVVGVTIVERAADSKRTPTPGVVVGWVEM